MIGRMLGQFILHRYIGSGEIGQVYYGENPENELPAALKILSPEFATNPIYIRGFLNEATKVAAIKHHNLARLLEFGQEHELYYVAMEYVDGETLQDWLDQEQSLPLAELLHIHLELLEGLKFAHSRNLIHRDIKPANIMIDKEGVVKLIDLGMARHKDPSESERVTLGSDAMAPPFFMAPEQAIGMKVDARSDLYAIGVSLYYCLCGQYPYAGPRPLTYVRNMLKTEPVPIHEQCKTISPLMSSVIMKLISKKATDRYQSAQETIAMLRECQEEFSGELAGPQTPDTDRNNSETFYASYETAKSFHEKQLRKAAAKQTGQGEDNKSYTALAIVIGVIGAVLVLLIILLIYFHFSG